MTIYTGTLYTFRATMRPDKAGSQERTDYLERVSTISGRHRFSYGYIGGKLADVDGLPSPDVCGFGFLPNLDAAKAYADELRAEGVFDRGDRIHQGYEATVYWPSMIPNAVDAYDPDSKGYKKAVFAVTRSAPDMSQMDKMAPYLTALKALYDRYGYALTYTGQRALDVLGQTPQTQIGIGTFPSVEQAVACHKDPEYAELQKLREELFYAFSLTLYGPLAG